ncbi:MAG: hypothetical protein HY675_09095 [Chloroflexi bacterium]|nr:hypothetical protein [Chloroflexota bacterium]
MHSSLIGKIEKAKRYAEERDRVNFSELRASFRGEHDVYHVSLKDGSWQCSCNFFAGWKVCSHTMALERILGVMVPRSANPPSGVAETAGVNGR